MKLGGTPRFRIDPNRARRGMITTSLWRAETPFLLAPERGEWIEVVDDEGNVLDALVHDIRGDQLDLLVKWETLRPAVVFEPRPVTNPFARCVELTAQVPDGLKEAVN